MPALAKRKKTADMPDSPPKRVTRSRAKATNDAGTKPTTLKVMTPSAKVLIDTKKPTEPIKTAKRKARNDEEIDKHDEPVEPKSADNVAGTRAKAIKAQPASQQNTDIAQTTRKTRGRQPKTTVTEEVKAQAPKPRARPVKSQNLALDAGHNGTAEEIPEVPKKATARTRAARATAKPPATSALPLSSAPEKKVKFQEDPEKDKENMATDHEKTAVKPIGLKARPIRKPATVKPTTRGRKAASSKPDAKTPSVPDNIRPLSPKKVKQVAKSSSIGSEDELCGEKTAVRALSQSPVKRPSRSVQGIGWAVGSKLDFTEATAPSSPMKAATPGVLCSPARRPPQSPFKDALKQSPKKGYLGDSSSQPVLFASHSPSKYSMMDSPKRGSASVSLKPSSFSQTPMKASLLQSPARRPGGSPTRSIMNQSPSKASSLARNEPDVSPASSPIEACSSPLRVSRTQVQSFKVHTISSTDKACVSQPSSSNPVSGEVATCGYGSPQVSILQAASNENVENDPFDERQYTTRCTPTPVDDGDPFATSEIQDGLVEHRGATSQDPATRVAPAFCLASPALRCSAEETDSEDELASPQKTYLNTPLSKQGVSAKNFPIETANSSLKPNARATSNSRSKRSSLAMTPLAVQMSAWLASSPEKRTPAAALQPEQTLSSHLEVSNEESPAKASFFEDEMAILDFKDTSTSDTPVNNIEEDLLLMRTSQESQDSEEYGDENRVPIDPPMDCQEVVPEVRTATCTPVRVFAGQTREIHTVSKVPLRPAADESPSPLKVLRKRSRSLATTSRTAVQPENSLNPASPPNSEEMSFEGSKYHASSTTPGKHRVANDDSLIMETPRTLRKSAVSDTLKGAVVYVDVHTTEGEDASGIFLELLAQMGARCVKQWSWNPRASLPGATLAPRNSEDDIAEPEILNNKVGITHVVYKDGGKRTLEKVRASKGLVHCIGVGWVLE